MQKGVKESFFFKKKIRNIWFELVPDRFLNAINICNWAVQLA